MQITVRDEAATQALAELLARYAFAGGVVILEGDLGAGKTTFVKGFARGLDIQSVIKSPTYTLIREYATGRLPLYHMDMYRLENIGASDLGLEEYLEGMGVTVIEWAVFIKDLLPDDYLFIRLEKTQRSLEERTIYLEAFGEAYTKWIDEWREAQYD